MSYKLFGGAKISAVLKHRIRHLKDAIWCKFWHSPKTKNPADDVICRVLSHFEVFFSDPAGTRTQDPNIKSVMLYRLSYGIISRFWECKYRFILLLMRNKCEKIFVHPLKLNS